MLGPLSETTIEEWPHRHVLSTTTAAGCSGLENWNKVVQDVVGLRHPGDLSTVPLLR